MNTQHERSEAKHPAPVHYVNVVRAGSGHLRPIVTYTLSLPSNAGAPLLIALSRDSQFPSLALCSDMEVPYVHGFVYALQNPLRLLEFASERYMTADVPRDNFLVLQQLGGLLYIARAWCNRALRIAHAFDDASSAFDLAMAASLWTETALGSLSGRPADTRVRLPEDVHKKLLQLAKLGARLAARWRAAAEEQQSASTSTSAQVSNPAPAQNSHDSRLCTLPRRGWEALELLSQTSKHRMTSAILAGRVGVSERTLRADLRAARGFAPPLLESKPGVGLVLTSKGLEQVALWRGEQKRARPRE